MTEQGQDPRLRCLLRIARDVTARRDLEDVLSQALAGLRSMVTFTGGSIQLVDDDGWITVAACDPPVPADLMERRTPLGGSLAGRVILTEQAIYIPDATADSRTLAVPAADWPTEVRTYLAVPLLVDGRAIGLLRIDDGRPSAFTESDQLLIATAATIIAAAIQNARADARVLAARRRCELIESRAGKVRDLIATSQRTPGVVPDRLRELLDAITETLADPAAEVDLRERRQRVS